MRHVVWSIRPPTYIVLLGGPGAGKGTLAAELAPELGLTHLSTGNLFRREIAQGTALGKVVQPIMNAGGLVPDEITLAVMAEELSRKRNWRGAVIDGFPRTDAQARLLDNLFSGWGQRVNFAFFLDGSKADLEVRLSGRRMCSNKDCGRTYHVVFSKPVKDGVCDKCNHALIQRDDDKAEVVASRIDKFNQTNGLILTHYERSRCLHRVKTTNTDPKGHVLRSVLTKLGKR
jgi:adenylate kinase